jgi:hypothetical protein
MDADQLIEQAIERVGSADFGPDGWREALDVLVHAFNTESALNELGEAVTAYRLTEHLVARLEIEQCFHEHPEIADEVIERPVFGLGLPRTGSTALSFLLSLDGRHRSLRTWEAGRPCPPPDAATEHDDPRIALAATEIEMINAMFPDFVGMLPTAPDGPQECLMLMALDFRTEIFEASGRIPSYSAYLAQCDMVPTYRYHRRVLQLLQWHCPPGAWWLKTPAHMQHIDALDEVYPDAQFVMTHRDITKVLPSVCALMSSLSAPMTDQPDPHYFGVQTTEEWERGLRMLIAFRGEDGNDQRFHDIQFGAMQTDPIGAVRGLYDHLGEELRPETEERMAQWWKENSSDRAGARRYDPAEFGLDLDQLSTQFAFYSERFAIPASPS